MTRRLSFGDVRRDYGQPAVDALVDRVLAEELERERPSAPLLPEWTFEEWDSPLWCQLVAWAPSGDLYVLAGHASAEDRWSGPFTMGPRAEECVGCGLPGRHPSCLSALYEELGDR